MMEAMRWTVGDVLDYWLSAIMRPTWAGDLGPTYPIDGPAKVILRRIAEAIEARGDGAIRHPIREAGDCLRIEATRGPAGVPTIALSIISAEEAMGLPRSYDLPMPPSPVPAPTS